MKTEIKIIVIFAVVMSIYCMIEIVRKPPVRIDWQLLSGVSTWRAPAISGLLLQTDSFRPMRNPFTERFFENAQLSGFIRTKDNQWAAIFYSEGFDTIVLEPGKQKKGIKLLSADGRSCKVKFGSATLQFSL